MDDTRPPPVATSSTLDVQLGQQPTNQAPITMADKHQLSNTVTPTTDTPLTEPSSSDTTNAQTQCILFRLPRELRNGIYEHVFGTGIVKCYIQLENAHNLAPQSDLTITCRRIHEEATAIHQAAFKTYWENNTFSYSLPLARDLPALTSQCFMHRDGLLRGRLEIRREPGSNRWEMFVHQDHLLLSPSEADRLLPVPVELEEGSNPAKKWLARIKKSRTKDKTLTAPST
jgi:hypothetical protein